MFKYALNSLWLVSRQRSSLIIAPKKLIQTVQFGTKAKKRPTSIVRSFWFKTFVFAEVGALFLSYFVWSKMNTSQEYRYFIKNNVPVLLEGYYQIGEQLGTTIDLRKHDEECWKKQGK